jgi:hypothetical protein
MLRRFTSALMAALLLGTLLAGAASAFRRTECGMGAVPDCCKRMGHAPRSPQAGAALPCCLVNQQRPAPAGTSFSFRFSPDATHLPRPQAARGATLTAVAPSGGYAPPFQPSHSPPAYIRHAAFLI